jgi:ABC-type amino acid transport substrate-binding protein
MVRQLRFTAVAAILVTIAGCSSADSTTASTSDVAVQPPEQLTHPGQLTIAADFQGPPFDYIEDDEHVGFDVEFDRAVGELMGLEVEHVDARFAALVPGLEAGRYDAVVSVLYITPERAEKIDLVPYAQTGSGFLVKADGDFQPQQPADLCGHTVAVLAGGFEEQLTTGDVAQECESAGNPVTVKSFPSDVEATRDLADGRSDAFFSNHSIVRYRADQLADLNLATSNSSPLFPIPAGIGVRKDRPDVRRAFEEAVDHLRESGELGDLLERYGLELPDPALVEEALAGKS